MAMVEVKVPLLSESVSEATLLQWKKKVGDAVARDEILIEIETDKVVLEVPAAAAGVLGEIVKADGSTVASDEVIAKIDTDAKPGATAPAPSAPMPAADSAPSQSAASGKAMPAAAKIMADNDVAPGQVQGTGKDGRITKGDALGAIAGGAKPAPAGYTGGGGSQIAHLSVLELRGSAAVFRNGVAEPGVVRSRHSSPRGGRRPRRPTSSARPAPPP